MNFITVTSIIDASSEELFSERFQHSIHVRVFMTIGSVFYITESLQELLDKIGILKPYSWMSKD